MVGVSVLRLGGWHQENRSFWGHAAFIPQVKTKDGTKMHYGTEAIKLKFEKVSDKKKAGGTITLEDLQTFHIYQNFVPKIIMSSVNQWTSELVSATAMVAMVSGHGAASTSDGHGPAKKGKTSHRPNAESEESASQVFSLFA